MIIYFVYLLESLSKKLANIITKPHMVEYDEIAYWPNKVSLFLLNIVAYCDHLSFQSVEKSALWLSPCMWLGFPLIFVLHGVPKSVFLGPFFCQNL